MDEQARYRWIAAHILPYEAEVRGWLRRHMHSLGSADVDDIVQEAYSRLWLADFSRIANGRSYFYTVVRNLLTEQARRARIIPMERMGEIDSLNIISSEPEPERRVSARQELERLQRVVEALPTQCRRAFELQKFDGLSQREIAAQMNIAEKTVEKHLAKALARVVAAMTSEAPVPGEASALSDNSRHDTGQQQD